MLSSLHDSWFIIPYLGLVGSNANYYQTCNTTPSFMGLCTVLFKKREGDTLFSKKQPIK